MYMAETVKISKNIWQFYILKVTLADNSGRKILKGLGVIWTVFKK